MFYWSNWMAWAPITAIFLARLSYGYTLRQVILINFVLPSFFSMIWMTILGGSALYFQINGTVDLLSILNEKGYGAMTYAVLDQFNLSTVLSVVYLFAVFISFVTATDSAVSAMASVSTQGIADSRQEAPLYVKVLWGGMVGAVSLIFISSLGIDGIKMLSYLGGLSGLALGILAIMSLIAMIKRFKQLDKVS
ncbi:MAG: BCCT family transporter [Ostreibacterium sp.]